MYLTTDTLRTRLPFTVKRKALPAGWTTDSQGNLLQLSSRANFFKFYFCVLHKSRKINNGV